MPETANDDDALSRRANFQKNDAAGDGMAQALPLNHSYKGLEL
jgi:hypothetical protein